MVMKVGKRGGRRILYCLVRLFVPKKISGMITHGKGFAFQNFNIPFKKIIEFVLCYLSKVFPTLINSLSSLKKGNHDHNGVWIYDLN